MDTAKVIERATKHLESLEGHVFDVLSVTKPVSPEAAVNLAKVISKLSPLLGNLIEFNSVELLNDQKEFANWGIWHRQDPDFPDTVFRGKVAPEPGLEIKAWFPLATEITARFKDSQRHFSADNIYVAMLAWLPERLIFGRPKIIDVVVVSGLSVAKSRDQHYHNPPDYLVVEPEDTSARTRNLQQTNTAGYKFQGTPRQFEEAEKLVKSWGSRGSKYSPLPPYQQLVRDLMNRFPYRLDTNFAKMDRIQHPEIEKFKTRVLNTKFNGMTVRDWSRVLCSDSDDFIRRSLEKHVGIKEAGADEIVK